MERRETGKTDERTQRDRKKKIHGKTLIQESKTSGEDLQRQE